MPTMPEGGTLALDLSASAIGWAYGPLEWKQPQSGTWILPKLGGLGARYAAFVDVFNEALEAWKPGNVYIEKPLPPNAWQTDTNAMEAIYGIVAFVREGCWRASVAYSGAHVDTIRTDVIGRCRWPGGKTKPHIVDFVRNVLGIDVSDHNEADACVAWQHRRQTILGIPSAKLPLLRVGRA